MLKYDIKEVLDHRQTKLLIAMLILTCFSIAHALVSLYVFNIFKVQFGYLILFLSTCLVLREKREFELFIWSFVLFHAVLVLMNMDKLGSTMRVGAFKGGYFLGDGNDFGWSLSIFFPLSLYLTKTASRKTIKLIAASCSLLLIFGIVGTSSRGASLALFASVAYFISTTDKKFASLLIVGMCLVVGLIFAPPSYLERMKSISDYELDSSVQGRLAAWKAATKMALDHPLGVGAGNFNSAYGRFYRTEVDTSLLSQAHRWISPHSIYFLVLGEYGFLGVLLLLMLIYSNFRDNGRTYILMKNKFGDTPTNWTCLSVCVNMSIVAYSVGGLFLGGINYPHIFIITFLTIRLKKIAESLSES